MPVPGGNGPWRRVAFQREGMPSAPLEGLRFARPQAVLARGEDGAWDEFGVRDPALLAGPDGYPALSDGRMVLYFTGSRDGGSLQGVGRAVSDDGGVTWRKEPGGPVLAPRPGEWDERIASTAWVLRDASGLYRMYYRGAGTSMFGEGIGLALSDDGVSFVRQGDGPVLCPGDFPGFPEADPRPMGVVNVVRDLGGGYLLTFEGYSRDHGGRVQIFGARSGDGERFAPLNGGRALFSADHVSSWPVTRVANPRVTVLRDRGEYLLVFNAHGDTGLYGLGAATSRDLEHWTEVPGNPLLLPGGEPLDDPFSGRLEGGVVMRGDLDGGSQVRMLLMGIPRRGPSHRNAVVGMTVGTHGPQLPAAFHALCAAPDEIILDADGAGRSIDVIPSPGTAFPPRVHFFAPALGSPASCRVVLDVLDGDGIAVMFGADLCDWRVNCELCCVVRRGRVYLVDGRRHRSLPGRVLARFGAGCGLGSALALRGARGLGAAGRRVELEFHVREALVVNAGAGRSRSVSPGHGFVLRDVCIQSLGAGVRIRNVETRS